MLLNISSRTREMEEHEITGAPEAWSRQVMEIMEKIEKHG